MAETTPAPDLGWTAADFRLPATDGKTYALPDIRGPKGTLIMVICNHCPYVRAVLPRILRDARELAGFGVGSAAISSNDATTYPEDSFENMKRLADREVFPFPYLHDESQEVARAYGAVCTPDFFGFDADLGLRYRGRLDASRDTPAPPDARRELFEAMRQIAETSQGPNEQNPSTGCSVKWR